MEIASLNNMTRHDNMTTLHDMSSSHRLHDNNDDNDLFLRTRLPSFSSIIGNSDMIATTTTCSSESSLLSVLHSTAASDLGLSVSDSHDHLMLHHDGDVDHHHHLGGHHADVDEPEDHDHHSDTGMHSSRRSSIDTGGLIIHDSLPGSRHPSPSVSRRSSVDHGSLLQHLNDRRSSVDQSLLRGSGLGLLTENHSSDGGLPDLTSLHPFMNHHDPTGDCRMSGSDPPTPANGLHPLCGIIGGTSRGLSRHYHSMPNSPRPMIVSTSSALVLHIPSLQPSLKLLKMV